MHDARDHLRQRHAVAAAHRDDRRILAPLVVGGISASLTPVAPGGAVTITRYAAGLGKPCVTAEAGHAGVSDAEDVDSLIQGCWKVARRLKMLSGAVSPVEHPLWLTRVSVMTSELDGVFCPPVGPEAYVSQGMKIGYVTDYFGKKVWDATSPIAGVVLYIGAVPSLKKGDTIAHIGEIGK